MNLFTAAYRSLPDDETKPMYLKTGGTVTIDEAAQVLTLNGGRMTIGALSTTTTTSESTPGGVLDLSKPYTIQIDIYAVDGDTSKKFQVYVDNNTTGQANSIHGSASKIFESLIGSLDSGLLTIDSNVGTADSFIQIRTETNASISIRSIAILYQDDGAEDPTDPEEPGDSDDPGDTEEPGSDDPGGSDDSEDPNDPADPVEPPKSGPVFLDDFLGVTDLFSASYMSLPGQPSVPMYYRGGGAITVNLAEDTVTLSGGRMTIGALSTESTKAGDEPPLGVFDLSKPYQIILNLTSASGDSGKKLQVYVDNNTTSQGNSMHGNASRIYNQDVDSITDYKIVIPSNVGTSASFIQIRTENGASVTIDSIAIIYEGEPDPTVPVPPAIPTGLSAEAGDEEVTLTWDPGLKVTGYTVRMWTEADPMKTEIDTVTNSVKITGLTNDVTYYFTVEAYNAAGGSGESNVVTATPKEGTAPESPKGLSATAGDGMIALRWEAVANADGYRVYQWHPEEDLYELVASVDRHSYTVTGLENGITYYYAVEAFNKRGTSPKTGRVSATPDAALTNRPLGFASLGNEGKGTTGGEGGTEVTVTTAADLDAIMRAREKAKSTEPIIIHVEGRLTFHDSMLDVKDTSNISIIGVGTDAIIDGFGLKIVRTNNIIVSNLTFVNAADDSIEVASSHNIWIHHNTFSNGYDGLLDIKEGSTNVTVAWNHFKDHRKTSLVGHSDNNGSVDINLKVTYHHNFFDGTYSRNPRVRFGQVHVVNNYYLNNGASIDGGGYGIGAANQSQLVVEGNYFENVNMPIIVGWPEWKDSPIGNYPGYVRHVNNVFDNSGEPHSNESGLTFNPADYYAFPVDDPHNVRQLVLKYAGAGRTSSEVPPDGEPGGGDDEGGSEDPPGGGDDEGGSEDPPGGGDDEGGSENPPGGGDDEGGSEDPPGGGDDEGGSEDPPGGGDDEGGSEDPPGGGDDTTGGPGNGGSSPPPTSVDNPPSNEPDTLIKTEEHGVVITPDHETVEENGRISQVYTVSSELLLEAFEAIAIDGGAQIIIEAEDNGQSETAFVLPVDVWAKAAEEGQDVVLSVRIGEVQYDLPIHAIDLQGIADRFVHADQAAVTISIARVTDQVNEEILSEIESSGLTRVAEIYEFTIQVSDGLIRYEWENLNTYVVRTIDIAADVSSTNHLTAIWYDESKGEWMFVPALFVTEGDRTTAIIKRNGNSIYTIVEHQTTFRDIQGHWAQSTIERMASKLIVRGVTSEQFKPDQFITRAEFASLLVRALGLKGQADDSFSDVESSHWFSDSVGAAVHYGLVHGISDELFAPYATITREQMAVMISRAMDLVGADVPANPSALARYQDQDQISSWAVEHAARAISAGIITGRTADTFAPQGVATRAEAVVMLYRFLKAVEFINP